MVDELFAISFFIPRRVLRFLNLHRWHRKSRISQLTSQDLFLNIQPRSFEFHFNLWCVSLSWPSYRDFQSTYENRQHSEQMIVFKDSEQTIAFNTQYWLAWIDVWGGSSQWTWENQSSSLRLFSRENLFTTDAKFMRSRKPDRMSYFLKNWSFDCPCLFLPRCVLRIASFELNSLIKMMKQILIFEKRLKLWISLYSFPRRVLVRIAGY